ncbi:polysaccharide pyruvyl transferase family protein [Kordiimonas aestuarii]|uniref:polysaccharide pyruvyl transferase family protein n=1 Tax=Kordiimonas aestuarii TaxID=1005925 RepID=UPI0021D1C605|nr:polysaccharide pyruvyl transferase family protein [Kordiimonas aestuarii]
MKRILFHPANFGVAANNAKLVHKASLPLSAARSIADLKAEIAATTLNVGNIVHNEAVAKSFEVDRAKSCLSSIEHLYFTECGGRTADFASCLTANFDAVVFSYANLIAPPLQGRADAQERHMARLCEVVEALPIPLYVFGMGMQEALTDASPLVPSMRELLKLIDKKAEIFGVRGAETEAFLHGMGCVHAVALGCPSLYVYPENILKIAPLKARKKHKVLTAGYLGLRHLTGYQAERVDFLRALASRYRVNYVFQNDIYSYHELGDLPGIYDDATGECDKAAIAAYMQAYGQEPIDFDGMWHFRDARSWRQFAAMHDFYFGDRFHGGVVALQASRPALFVYKDLRVRELTNHFAIPNVALAEVTPETMPELLRAAFSAERTERFREQYAARLGDYHFRCRDAGLMPRGAHPVGAVAKPAAAWRTEVARIALAASRVRRKTDARPEGRTIYPEFVKKRNRVRDQITAAVELLMRPKASAALLEPVVRTLLTNARPQAAQKCLTCFLDTAQAEIATLPDDACFRLANLYNRYQMHEAARRIIELLYVDRERRGEKNARLYANILLAEGNYTAAEQVLMPILGKGAADAATEFQLARAAFGQGRAGDAIARAEAALAHKPEAALLSRIEHLKGLAERSKEAGRSGAAHGGPATL